MTEKHFRQAINKNVSATLKVRNMVCSCCCRVLRMELEALGVEVKTVKLGSADIEYNPTVISMQTIYQHLEKNGFSLAKTRDEELVEQLKIAVIELIHYYNNVNSLLRNSDFLVEKLGYSYPYLSKIFSRHENMTLEKYIILQKIEKIKELIESGEYTLSEIAYMMGYSSVQYLSAQFKKITGMSVTEYKNLPHSQRIPINQITRQPDDVDENKG